MHRAAAVPVVLVVALASLVAALELEPLPSVNAYELTPSQFEAQFVAKRQPVVVRGYMLPALKRFGDNARDAIREMCGKRLFKQTCSTPTGPLTAGDSIQRLNNSLRGVSWAALQDADDTVAELGIRTVEQLLNAQEHVPEAKDLYLHDISIHKLCPGLLEATPVPSLFPIDVWTWIQDQRGLKCPEKQYDVTKHSFEPTVQTQYPGWDAYEYPSLYVGGPGTGMGVHTDLFGVQSWMVGVEGTMQYRIFREEDSPFLSPRRTVKFEPIESFRRYGLFEADVFNPDYKRFPFLATLRGWECNLTKGDILYIPAGFPRSVHNPQGAVSYGYKFVDKYNLEFHNRVTYMYVFEKNHAADTSRVLLIPAVSTGSGTQNTETCTGAEDQCTSSQRPVVTTAGTQFKELGHSFYGVWYNTGTEMFLQLYTSRVVVPRPVGVRWETLDQYVLRQHPLQLMKMPVNKALWDELTDEMDFQEFFNEWPGVERKDEDMSAEADDPAGATDTGSDGAASTSANAEGAGIASSPGEALASSSTNAQGASQPQCNDATCSGPAARPAAVAATTTTTTSASSLEDDDDYYAAPQDYAELDVVGEEL